MSMTGGTEVPSANGAVPMSELAAAVATAAVMLDSEEHRYVERSTPCPNGCGYDYATEAVVGPDRRRVAVPMMLVKVEGPAGCELCVDGTVDDEQAEHLDPLIANLRAAAEMLAKAQVHVR